MGGFGFFIIIIAFGFLWFVLIRPQKKRQLQQQRMLTDLAVGDEIVTAGGLYGEVREVHDDEVLVRIAPELDVRIARRAVAGIITPDEPDEPQELEAPPEPEQTGPTPGT